MYDLGSSELLNRVDSTCCAFSIERKFDSSLMARLTVKDAISFPFAVVLLKEHPTTDIDGAEQIETQ